MPKVYFGTAAANNSWWQQLLVVASVHAPTQCKLVLYLPGHVGVHDLCCTCLATLGAHDLSCTCLAMLGVYMTAWDTSGGKAEQAQSPSPSCFKLIFLHWLLSSLSLSWLYLLLLVVRCTLANVARRLLSLILTYGRYTAPVHSELYRSFGWQRLWKTTR